jgi:hypothetical protein
MYPLQTTHLFNRFIFKSKKTTMKNDKTRQFLTLLAILGMVAMTIIGQVSDLGGKSIDESADDSFTLINPADYAFSIWGLIYLGLFAFGIYQALPAQRDNPRFRRASGWIIANALANIAWYPAAYNQVWNQGLSTLLIFIMLYTLVEINRALEIRRTTVPTTETWLAQMPFAIYFGWITVATPVSVASMLVYNGWNGGGFAPDLWAVLIIGVSLVLSCLAYLRVTNFAYLIVIAWGFIAIAIAQQSNSNVVYWAALVGAVLAIVVGIARYFSERQAVEVIRN